MYDEATINKAMSLLSEGHSPREVSRIMGGRPGHTIIRRWAQGKLPVGHRRTPKLYSLEEKLGALERVAAGENYHAVSEDLGCAGSAILTWRKLYEQGGADALRTRLDDR